MGERSIQEKYQAWRKCPGMNEELHNQLKAMSPDELNDSFYRSLAFGTGGLRGVLGAGENRMNLYTVSKATRGLGRYLLETCEKPSCAVSCDSRIHSRDFAELTAATLAEMGIRVYLYRTLMPTPMLSYAVRHLHTSAGVMVTASHNPAKFNGYKVYGADGCQITIEAADRIYSFISAEQTLQPSLPSFQKYLDNGMISYIDDETIESYYQMINGLRIAPTDERLHIVYSPLNGTGNVPVREMLKRMGNIDVDVVAEQEMPDGHFPTCPYPNPEIRQAMELGLQYCDRVHPDILIGTDPDCDRCGTAVPDGKGGYRLISGNEMGVILLDFICRSRIANGTMPENPVAVTTIVSTDMVTAVANKYGVELRRVLTGFKYIGEQIALLEAGGHPERYIFGFEESYGYLSGPHVRDKDAVNAVLLICEAAAWYAKKGMTLGDAIDALYAEFGCFCNAQKSFTFAGETGMEKMASLMSGLRTHPLQSVAGLQVEGFTDYEQDGTGLPKANVLEYRLPGGAKLIIRPSGTEPKIKAYLSAVKPTVEEATRQLDTLAAAAAELLA